MPGSELKPYRSLKPMPDKASLLQQSAPQTDVGLQRELATLFVEALNLEVAPADIDPDAAWLVAREIGGMAIRCDVSRESDVAQLIEKVETAKGRIDLFCSNAGIAGADEHRGAAVIDEA